MRFPMCHVNDIAASAIVGEKSLEDAKADMAIHCAEKFTDGRRSTSRGQWPPLRDLNKKHVRCPRVSFQKYLLAAHEPVAQI